MTLSGEREREREREREVLSNSGLFCLFGQSLLFFLTRARVLKFLYFKSNYCTR